MAKRNVVWTKTADIQFVGILEYWVNRNKSNKYSKKLVRLVTDLTRQIAENPKIYRKTNFKDVRVASMGNFSLFYKFNETQIIVMAFWDNRQNPKKLNDLLEKQR